MPIFIDIERDGTLVVREIETTRAGAFMAAVMDAARRLHAVIQRLELRPRRDWLDARIVVESEHESVDRSQQLALVEALLSDLRPAAAA